MSDIVIAACLFYLLTGILVAVFYSIERDEENVIKLFVVSAFWLPVVLYKGVPMAVRRVAKDARALRAERRESRSSSQSLPPPREPGRWR